MVRSATSAELATSAERRAMSGGMSGDEEYRALLREAERLEAQNARLREELGLLTDEFADEGPPEEIARGYEDEADEGDPAERAQNLSEAASYWAMAGEF